VDYEALGFKAGRDPRREDISKTRRAAILDEMMAECQGYVSNEFPDVLKARCREILGAPDAWSLHVSEQDLGRNEIKIFRDCSGTERCSDSGRA
jgi:hypothetical protein